MLSRDIFQSAHWLLKLNVWQLTDQLIGLNLAPAAHIFKRPTELQPVCCLYMSDY